MASEIDLPADTPQVQAQCRPDAPQKRGGKVRLRSLSEVDRRTSAAKAAFALRDELATDLGGWPRLSAMQRELIENTAVLGAMLKDASARYLKGEPVDLGEFMALTNAQRRLLADLGLERQLKNITPNVGEYLRQREGERPGQMGASSAAPRAAGASA